MATECTQEVVVQFLTDRGGRVKKQELIDYFKAVFPEDPEQKAIVREKFKGYVDNVAFVKLENGVKCVCLKNKYRVEKDSACNGNGTGTFLEQDSSTPVLSKSYKNLIEDCAPQLHLSASSAGGVRSWETTANDAQQDISPGSGYGTDNAAGVRPPDISGIILEGNILERAASTRFVVQNNSLSDIMGNALGLGGNGEQKLTKEDIQTLQPHDIPQIAVIETSPLPTAADGSMFHLPGRPFPNNAQYSLLSNHPSSEHGADEGHNYDSLLSKSGSDSNTPKGSHNNVIELMMNSSPQVRRSMVLRNSVYLSAKYRDCTRSDSDSASVASVTLDPLEHEWMMCASDGQWESLHRLLSCEPNLAMKKDFVTGFTCLHWAAKQGKQELLALIVNFSKQHTVPININARSSAGYTPLHLAAMHNHVEVVKLLVGAYDADVEARDYNGKRACQYLTSSVAVDIRDIIGAGGVADSDSENTDSGGHWRLSKVLQSNLMPLKLHSHCEEDTGDGAGQARQQPLRRKSSLSKMRPKLQKIRFRSSQIVHSTSFPEHCETEELNGSRKSSFKSRPMSNLFG
ncbi:ankyrin repeat domain-containing protein SOWAHC-like [Salvelinus fontinalis]|uniref:ankyrin repeat domain-containing protein SOWAHC-like n=1 Tax=Salvelinus fontinalis TaxID=8038 RepID=UPI0024862793|nr:ankyrin repeat domain-containing protein SOWAHC-like [Salvelinus fontinalis]